MGKYQKIIEKVFFDNYRKGDARVIFQRQELAGACKALGFDMVKNLGDIPYTFRFRRELPKSINDTAPSDNEWIITGSGISQYEFRQASRGKIVPASQRLPIPIPDATPEIVKHYSSGEDEQALLTRVRYNRLIDLFTGLTCYSVQNHLRTTVENLGQIEVDEIYMGINSRGIHFVLPCQAKSPGDKFGIAQVMQDISLCRSRYPEAVCRPIALQNLVVMELTVTEENDILNLHVVDEKHFKLVLKDKIDRATLEKLKHNHDQS